MEHTPDVTRRGAMKGIGGLAMFSLSGATVQEAQAALLDEVPSDPHTLDTYRALVDAVIPRTPELAGELGPEHVPGALDIELEKFFIWDLNHFQKIHIDLLSTEGASVASSEMSADRFETTLDTTEASSDLDASVDVAKSNNRGRGRNNRGRGRNNRGRGRTRDTEVDKDALREHLSFGAIERVDLSVKDTQASVTDSQTDGADHATFDLAIETENETTSLELENYPYAPLFAIVLDIIAAEFIVRGKNEDRVMWWNSKFPAGGTFVRLSPKDRLRCLWFIVEGSVIDDLDDLLSPYIPQIGLLKFIVTGINAFHGFGYYTEWSGYGDTKTAPPTERELATPSGEVQSHEQTDYPGPAPGYAADWRYVIDGGFKDPENLNLPDDLTGDDVLEGIGGGGA